MTQELAGHGRPTGPNQITQLQETVFKSKKVGDQLVQEIDLQTPIRPSYRQAILGAMKCFDWEGMRLNPDHLSYCRNCEFGPSGNRTLCVEHQGKEEEPEPLGYVIRPSISYQEYINDKDSAFIAALVETGIQTLEEENFAVIESSELSKFDTKKVIGFEPSPEKNRAAQNRISRFAHMHGIGSPDQFEPTGILNTEDIPLVAKHKYSHKGQLKFLLENRDQKVNFLTWSLLCTGIETWAKYELNELKGLVSYFQQQFDSNPQFQGFEVLHDLKQTFEVQEFMQGPSFYASSYRILVTGYGDIISGQSLISKKPKYERNLKKDWLYPDIDTIELAKLKAKSPKFDAFRDLAFLLMHSQSPLFLDTYDVVSNYASGSHLVVLKGQKVEDVFFEERAFVIRY